MLTRLYCDNFKCLVNFEFRPSSLQLLMGRNGAGKSTAFEVLELLRDFAGRGDTCDGRLVGTTRTRWQDVEEQRFELDVVGDAGTYRYELRMDEWGHPARPRVRREAVTLDGKPVFLFAEGLDHEIVGLVDAESRSVRECAVEQRVQADESPLDPRRMSARAEREDVHPGSTAGRSRSSGGRRRHVVRVGKARCQGGRDMCRVIAGSLAPRATNRLRRTVLRPCRTLY